jgi:DNA-binding HxlR family transcriptional regulator
LVSFTINQYYIMIEISNKNLETCPVRKSLTILGGKWKLLIINQFSVNKSLRYGELKRAIPDISEKMLNQELKILVKHNVLIKKSYPVTPPKVEYYITEIGERVMPIIQLLADFGQKTN